jgi:hypothetical protein
MDMRQMWDWVKENVPQGGMTPPLEADPEVVNQGAEFVGKAYQTVKGKVAGLMKDAEGYLPTMPPGGMGGPLEADPSTIDAGVQAVKGFVQQVQKTVQQDPSVLLNNTPPLGEIEPGTGGAMPEPSPSDIDVGVQVVNGEVQQAQGNSPVLANEGAPEAGNAYTGGDAGNTPAADPSQSIDYASAGPSGGSEGGGGGEG